MNVLVTGGAGYIGSHMSRMLDSMNIHVVVLDSMEFGHEQALPGNIVLTKGNVSDAELLRRVFTEHNIDAVMHFAGYLRVEESVKFPVKYMQNNIIGPTTMLETMRECGVKSLIFSSTAAVYGNPLTVPIVEDHRKEPLSPYGLSKWAFERLLRVYDRSFGIRSISLRYFNAAGAALDGTHGEVHDQESHLIPLACFAALGRRERFSLFGTDYDTPDGSALRDFIHIEDLCRAHICALDALANGHPTDTYNVGTGHGVSVKEVVNAVRSAAGKDFPVQEAGRRSGDPAVLVADATKLMNEFSWKPQYSDIQTIVASAFAWHASHPDGYAK